MSQLRPGISMSYRAVIRQFFRWQTMASRPSYFLCSGIPVLRKCEEDWEWRGNSFLQESPFHSPISSHFLWSGIPGQRKCDGNERWRRKKSFSKEFLISHPPNHVSFGQEFPTMGKERSGRREGRGGEGGGENRIVEKQRKVTQHSRASGSSTSIATITSTITSALTSIITSTITSSVISPITSLLFTDSLRAPPSLLAAGPILSTLLNFYFLPVSLKVKLMKKSAFPHGRADRFFPKIGINAFWKNVLYDSFFQATLHFADLCWTSIKIRKNFSICSEQ